MQAQTSDGNASGVCAGTLEVKVECSAVHCGLFMSEMQRAYQVQACHLT